MSITKREEREKKLLKSEYDVLSSVCVWTHASLSFPTLQSHLQACNRPGEVGRERGRQSSEKKGEGERPISGRRSQRGHGRGTPPDYPLEWREKGNQGGRETTK